MIRSVATLIALMAISGLMLPAASSLAATYVELKTSAVKECQAIDPNASQSGLMFNPDGYRSFYLRSQCFQNVAVQFRDDALCEQVKRRWSLFSSSWGYSLGHCHELVMEGAAVDRKALEDLKRGYIDGRITLTDFHVERNGNGRDFDIIPSFSGARAGSYRLAFEILPTTRNAAQILLYSASHHAAGDSKLRLFVTQDELRQRFPGLALDRLYSVRATLILDVGMGGQAGYWSDAFIERAFPIRERSQTITREVHF